MHSVYTLYVQHSEGSHEALFIALLIKLKTSNIYNNYHLTKNIILVTYSCIGLTCIGRRSEWRPQSSNSRTPYTANRNRTTLKKATFIVPIVVVKPKRIYIKINQATRGRGVTNCNCRHGGNERRVRPPVRSPLTFIHTD